MARKIVSGGQTGADRGALDAAIERGLPHGGFCPRGRRAEDGTIPERYDLVETAEADYSVRTRRNVVASDATLVFTRGAASGGTAFTIEVAREVGRPLHVVDLAADVDLEALAAFVRAHAVLNVAGPRESGAPGIGDAVRRTLLSVLPTVTDPGSP